MIKLKDILNEGPGPGDYGSVRISIDDDIIDMIKRKEIKFEFPYLVLPDSNELWVYKKHKKKAEYEVT